MKISINNLYIIRKNAALWQVVLKSSGIVQFSSLSKARCNDWLAANYDSHIYCAHCNKTIVEDWQAEEEV